MTDRVTVFIASPATSTSPYGDFQGGQRVISRFSLLAREDGGWLATLARHGNVDRPDPR